MYTVHTPCLVAYSSSSNQYSKQIFTMTMPGQKMYIVTKPELIQSIQKQPKALAFPPIEAKFATKICGSSDEAHRILMKNLNGDEGDWGLSMDSYACMRAALSPGPGLDDMNRVMIQNIAASLDSLKPASGSRTKIGLAKWLRRAVTEATTNSVYGPQNPFKDVEVADAFWYVLNAIRTGTLLDACNANATSGNSKATSWHFLLAFSLLSQHLKD